MRKIINNNVPKVIYRNMEVCIIVCIHITISGNNSHIGNKQAFNLSVKMKL